MSQHLDPTNKGIGIFKCQFSDLLECCNYLFPAVFERGQWYYVYDADERLPGGLYCPLLEHGFPVTEEEARIMARFVRNWVTVQRSLARSTDEWPHRVTMSADYERSMTDFADWAEASGGFQVW